MFKVFTGAAVGPQDTVTTQMKYTDSSVSPQHSFSENEKTEVDAESMETEHECPPSNCVPRTGDFNTTAACRVLEGTRVTPSCRLFLP